MMNKITRSIPFFVISFGLGFLMGSAIFGAFKIDNVAGYIVLAACAILIGVTWVLNKIINHHAKPRNEFGMTDSQGYFRVIE